MSNHTESRQDRIINIIRQLMNKTVENGCSESEALAASEKVRKLCDQYAIEEHALASAKGEKIAFMTHNFIAPEFFTYIMPRMAEYCGLKVWRDHHKRFVVFGTRANIEFCGYLIETIKSVYNYSWLEYKIEQKDLGGIYHKPSQASFYKGFAHRISHRFIDMIEKAKVAQTVSDSRALVVISNELDEAFGELNLKLRTKSSPRIARDSDYLEGYLAGNKPSLSRVTDTKSFTAIA